jgi:ORF6N domain
VLNQAVKRNIKRFPKDFMFQLDKEEFESFMFQIATLQQSMSSQFVMTYPNKRPTKSLPYAFTEQGVAMLSGILNSDKAINMNISIMRAFVEIRRAFLQQNDFKSN